MKTLKLGSNSIRVFYRSLPESVHGVCAKESETDYLIIINSDMPTDLQAEALEHELMHIQRKDFDRTDASVNEIEKSVHRAIRYRKEV